MAYSLHVVFKSNERPWSTNYEGVPPGPKDDNDAKRWADGMQANLDAYTVTLMRDGKPIYFPTPPEDKT